MNINELFRMGMDRDIPTPYEFMDGIVFNLGAGGKTFGDAINLDLPEWDANRDKIPAEDGTVRGIHAYHFLEHVKDPIKMLIEIQRVLAIGGVCNIVVPYYSSAIAHQDLAHLHTFTEDTWKILFRNPYYNAAGKTRWLLQEHLNVIIGIAERNVVLLTQLVKVAKSIPIEEITNHRNAGSESW